jgi:hypothetical protein
MNKYLRWFLLFIPALLVEILCWFTNPIACLFVRVEPRTDRVKRQGDAQVTMLREYPIKLFDLWNTHDNALDEYWHGLYNEKSWFKAVREWTQADYDNCWFKRYYCRVAWLMRNNAYGWNYKLFSLPNDSPYLWQYENKERGTNIGYKSHKGFNRSIYANRLFKFK